ncbi:MAG: WG repeat-containing protein [Myxococcota bacterium]
MLIVLLSSLLGSIAQAADLTSMAKPAGEDEWGYIDTSGAFVIEPKYRKCFPFSEDGYAPIFDKKRKSWVFIDPKGQELAAAPSPLNLKNVFGFGTLGFDDGLAPITVGKKWGYLGTDGKIAIPVDYDEVSQFDGGYAAARKSTSHLVIDTKGAETKVAVPVLELKHFQEGLAPMKGGNSLWGFVDTKGAVAVEAKFKSVGYFVDGHAWAKTEEGMVGFIDTQGTWVIDPKYVAAKDFGPGSGLARVKPVEDWVFVRTDGSILSPPSAEGVSDFSEGLASAKVGDKHGFFDATGKWVIEPAFDGVRDFKNGYAAAKQGELWGFIDTKGAWVVKPTLSGVRDFEKTE